MHSDELQDELGAIDAIYPGTLKEIGPNIYQLAIPSHEEVSIQMSFPDVYPEDSPHIIQVTSKDLDLDVSYLEILFNEVLDSIFHQGEVCIFDFLSELESILYVEPEEIGALSEDFSGITFKNEESYEEISHERVIDATKYDKKKVEAKHDTEAVNALAGWTISDPVTDRGSTFIAFKREVHSVEEAQGYLDILLTDKKIMKSNHNMTSWRIKNDNGTQIQDCDDDGETAAGSRILHLMTMMDVWNAVIVVSRWFGGTHIGPDRFKHINSTARDAIMKSGCAPEKNSKSGKKKKKK